MRLAAHAVPALAAAGPPAGHASAVLLGLMYGVLHVVGPDHLGTIMSLSAAATPKRAFRVGALWSLGHTLGMAIAAALIIAAQRYFSVDIKAWESFGDYAIGTFMVFVGVCLFALEDSYISKSADGSTSLKACDCHGHVATDPEAQPSVPEVTTSGRSPKKTRFAAEYGGCSDSKCLDEACAQPKESLVTEESQGMWQSLSSTLLGVAQGVCCPMGLVGLVILTSLSALSMALFFLVFLTVSTVGTGAMSLAWARVVVSGGSGYSTHALYRASCGITVLMGIAWIVANYCGVLDKLNYAENMAPSVLRGATNSTMQ